jgi:hypothetical protein
MSAELHFGSVLAAAIGADPDRHRLLSLGRQPARSAARAAKWPHIPCTPAPGGVDAEQR